MANAVLTDSQSASNYTYSQLVAAIKSAMTNAGFGATYFDDQSANTNLRFIVWRIQMDGDTSKARAYIYYRLKIIIDGSDYKIQQRWYYTWNATTHAGTVFTDPIDCGVVIPTNGSGQTVKFTAINHPELKAVIVNFAASYGIINLFTPLNKVDGWGYDNIQYCAAFIADPLFDNLHQPGIYPFNDDGVTNTDQSANATNPQARSLDPYADAGIFKIDYNENYLGRKRSSNLKFQLIPTAVVGSLSKEGAAAYSSQDLAIVASEGLGWLTKLSDGTRNYMIVSPRSYSNVVTGSLAIAIP